METAKKLDKIFYFFIESWVEPVDAFALERDCSSNTKMSFASTKAMGNAGFVLQTCHRFDNKENSINLTR